MTKTKFLSQILLSSLVLFFYHAITLKLHLFFISPLLDIPSHVLGGFVVALALAYFGFGFLRDKKKIQLKFFLILGVLIVGVLWEVFEIKYYITTTAKQGYWLDTYSDIFFDFFGAFLAYVYLIKKFYVR